MKYLLGLLGVALAGSMLLADEVLPIVQLLSEAQRQWLALPNFERVRQMCDFEVRQRLKLAGDAPEKFFLKYHAQLHDDVKLLIQEEVGNGKSVPAVDLRVVRHPDAFAVMNCKCATRYHWQILVNANVVQKGCFATAEQAPRLLKVDGVGNFRDLGGWCGYGGKRIRQGMIFRSEGLNCNAEAIWKRREIAADSEAARRLAERCAILAFVQDRLNNPEAMPTVPYALRKEWQVFFPDEAPLTGKTLNNPPDFPEIAVWNTIPEKWNGKVPETVTPDEQGFYRKVSPQVGAPMILAQEFDAPQDGVMRLACMGDWFWDMRINGEKICDFMRYGNYHDDGPEGIHQLEIPVRQGKNLLIVTLRSGDNQWQWFCAPGQEGDFTRFIRERVEFESAEYHCQRFQEIGLKAGQNRLNQEMQRYLAEGLGIRTELDFRNDNECFGMTGSPVGKNIRRRQVPIFAYQEMGTEYGKKAFAEAFRVMLDPKDYPILFHCKAGQDRTGCFAWILNALLGVSEEDLRRDWETTVFYNSSMNFNHKWLLNRFLQVLNEYPGENMNQKVENYVLSTGIMPAEIECFRKIMQ